jgi:hypothetical protein
MIVCDKAEVVDKLYRLGEQFDKAFSKRDFAYAMATRHTAMTVVLFLMDKENDCDKELLKILFGDGNGPEEDVKGVFNRDKVEKARLECIRGNKNFPYVEALEFMRVMEIIK